MVEIAIKLEAIILLASALVVAVDNGRRISWIVGIGTRRRLVSSPLIVAHRCARRDLSSGGIMMSRSCMVGLALHGRHLRDTADARKAVRVVAPVAKSVRVLAVSSILIVMPILVANTIAELILLDVLRFRTWQRVRSCRRTHFALQIAIGLSVLRTILCRS